MEKQKIRFGGLYLEVTRRCNMHCDHCLRGDARGGDFNPDALRPLLEHTESIDTLGFTGGEPSLCPEILTGILEVVNEYKIPVGGFYLVTNGKEVSDGFLTALVRWNSYCLEHGDPYLSGLALSKDEFHESIPWINEQKLRSFAFFQEDKFMEYLKGNYPTLIARGRAAENFEGTEFLREAAEHTLCPERDGSLFSLTEHDLLVTVNGSILPDCNYAYDEEAELTIGNVRQPEAFLSYLGTLLEE